MTHRLAGAAAPFRVLATALHGAPSVRGIRSARQLAWSGVWIAWSIAAPSTAAQVELPQSPVGCPLAEAESLGGGTTGAAGQPVLEVLGLPAIGWPAPGLAISSGPADAPALLVIGVPGAPTPLPGLGSELVPAAPLWLRAVQLDDSGSSGPSPFGPAALPLSACDVPLVVQGVVADPGAQGGHALTPAWRLQPGAGASAASLFPWPAGRTAVADIEPAVGDMDGDGRTDVLLHSGSGPLARISVLRQLADGTLAPPVVTPTLDVPASSAAVFVDRNGDGVPDMTAAVRNGTGLVSRGGRPDGTFSPPVLRYTVDPVQRLLVADLDGDGHLDALVYPWNLHRVAVLPGADGLDLAAPIFSTLPAAFGLPHLELADMDGDGALDLVALDNQAGPGEVLQLAILPGLGDGRFGAAELFDVPLEGVTALAVGELHGDGRPDVVVGGILDGAGQLAVYPGDGRGGLLPAVTHFVAEDAGPSGQAASIVGQCLLADLAGDGSDDLFVAGTQGSWITRSTGGADLAPLETITGGWRLAIADMDGDTHLDLVGSFRDLGLIPAVHWVRGSGDGSLDALAPMPALLDVDDPWSIVQDVLADLDGDGAPEALARRQDGSLALAVNDGAGGLVASPAPDLGGPLRDLAVSDWDGDGVADLLAVHSNGQAPVVALALGLGDGSFATAELTALPSTPRQVDVGDVDGDGRADAVVSHASVFLGPWLSTLPGQADGNLGAPVGTAQPGLSSVQRFHLADMTGDGDLDVVATTAEGLALAAGTGAAGFSPPVLTPGTAAFVLFTLPLGIGDLDGDGDLDVVRNDSVHGLRGHANDGTGVFTSLDLPDWAFAWDQDPLLVDVNLDGALDVVTELGLCLGFGDGSFSAWHANLIGGGAAADVDGDGDADLLSRGVLLPNALR